MNPDGNFVEKEEDYSPPRSILIPFANISFNYIVVTEFGLGLGGGSYADG